MIANEVTNTRMKLTMAFKTSQNLIENRLESDSLRLDETAFIRERSLGAKHILRIILQRIYHALQLCLDSYFDDIDEITVSKQAFSKVRKSLRAYP